MTQLPPSVRRFEAIEQLDEWHRELDWPLQYRQIEAGPLTSAFMDVEGDNWFLMKEQSNRQFEIEAGSPDGMFMLAVLVGRPAMVGGRNMGGDRLLVQAPDTDFAVALPAHTIAIQIGVSEEVFDEMLDALAPDFAVPRGEVSLFDLPGRLANVQRAMSEAIQVPSGREATRDEAAANILGDLITALSDHSPVAARPNLRRAAARRAVDKAREYIEANLSGTIRVASMCRYSGTTHRTLERIFSRELGVSPKQYVMARRLNAVRRGLLVVGDEHDHPVTEVAQNHGFNHLGRFAADYRRLFGEYPRETLQNR